MNRILHSSRGHAAWPALLAVGLFFAASRGTAEEIPNAPIISFLGVSADSSVGDERSHELEKDFSDALQKCTGVTIQLPGTLDENLGLETREGLRDSEVLAAHLSEYSRVLGDYVVVMRVSRKPPRNGASTSDTGDDGSTATEEERPLVSQIRVLKVSTQKEVFAVTVPSRDTVAVKNLVARIQELGVPAEEPAAPPEKQQAPAEQAATPPEKQQAPAEQAATPPEKQQAPVEQPAAPAEEHEAPAEQPATSSEPPPAPKITPPPEPAKPPKATIEHTPIENAPANAPIMVQAVVSASGKFFVTAYFRRSAKDEWSSVDLVLAGDHKFAGALPALPDGTLDYYLDVTDGSFQLIANSGSRQDPHHIEITPPPKPRVWRKDLGWALATIGVATLAAGIGVGVISQQQQTRYKQTYEPGSAVLSQLRSVNTQAVGADVLLPAGGVLAVAGGTLVILF